MPVKKSAFKALRQTEKKTQRNKKYTSDITALSRKVRKAVDASDTTAAGENLAKAIKRIDKAAQKGAIKKNTAARQKSRLSKVVNSLATKKK